MNRTTHRLAAALLTFWAALWATAASADGPPPPPPRPLLLVHDMPWFEARPFGPAWGWHWTMNRHDPEKLGPDGRRQVASHLDPLIGPYDSADPDVLEYHTLLMRVAGLDGVIADWYGTDAFNDYAGIHRRTTLLFEAAGRRGLQFALCYEDRALKAMAGPGRWSPAEAAGHARSHLQAAERDWFGKPGYVRLRGAPLFLVFGPDYLKPGQWVDAFAGLKTPPAFFTLDDRKPPALGAFAWPPMYLSKDGRLEARDLDTYLDRFDSQPQPKVAGAFPGFHDAYAEAGVQPSHGFLDDLGGETLRRTLGRAIASGAPVVQVITWNDFGEGTCVEPTRERGYRDLETLQDARRRLAGPPPPFVPADLRLPLRLYRLRKRAGGPPAGLDRVADLLAAGKAAEAGASLDALEAVAARPAR